MKTIKCKIVNEPSVSDYIRKYNDVLRISFKQIQNGVSQPNIKKLVNPRFEGLNSFIIQNAIVEAQCIYKRHQQQKQEFEKNNPTKKFRPLVFGGRNNLNRYLKHLITKEEFKKNRQLPMTIAGETRHNGNRLFDLHTQDNNVVFKPKKGIKIPIEFVLSKKQKEELLKVQQLCLDKKFSVAIRVSTESIYFIYDDKELNGDKFHYDNLKENRVLGIDQNPNYLGVSVLEFDANNDFKVIHKRVFDLSKLTTKSHESSCSSKSKHIVNKRRFETLNLAHEIDKMVDYWKVKKVVVEDLNFKSKLKGKGLNRLCRNSWDRKLFENKLKMLSDLHGFELVEVNPCYTSIVGNILYGNDNTPDMVAASIEIGRRGYRKFEKNWFYPDYENLYNLVNEQWKQTLLDRNIVDWKDLFKLIKNSGLKYRVLLSDVLNRNKRSFSLNHKKSMVSLTVFNDF